jgi:hypothetical protein
MHGERESVSVPDEIPSMVLSISFVFIHSKNAASCSLAQEQLSLSLSLASQKTSVWSEDPTS